jgi:hypothetical protein
VGFPAADGAHQSGALEDVEGAGDVVEVGQRLGRGRLVARFIGRAELFLTMWAYRTSSWGRRR